MYSSVSILIFNTDMIPTSALSTEVERSPRPQSKFLCDGPIIKFEATFRVIRQQSGCLDRSFEFLNFGWGQESKCANNGQKSKHGQAIEGTIADVDRR